MEEERRRTLYFSLFNACFWMCCLTVLAILFISFLFRYSLPVIFWIPAIVGILFLFLCVFAIAGTCTLPISTTNYCPQKKREEVMESVLVEDVVIEKVEETPNKN
eukprot:gene4756-8338_t